MAAPAGKYGITCEHYGVDDAMAQREMNKENKTAAAGRLRKGH